MSIRDIRDFLFWVIAIKSRKGVTGNSKYLILSNRLCASLRLCGENLTAEAGRSAEIKKFDPTCSKKIIHSLKLRGFTKSRMAQVTFIL